MEMDHTGKKKTNNVPLYSNKQKRDRLHSSCMERMKEANTALRRWGRRISSSRQSGLQGKTLARIGAEEDERRKRLKGIVYIEIVSSVLQAKTLNLVIHQEEQIRI